MRIGACLMCSCCDCAVVVCVFFFQAEDGIRDLVRSRGLGDVYKRQTLVLLGQVLELKARGQTSSAIKALLKLAPNTARTVSYTHLTLPTSDLV
mgnify:CR=1 FL=1